MKRLSRNHIAVASCVAVLSVMAGLVYASVPLYEMFCRVTGYAGTPGRAVVAPTVTDDARVITVRFDANVDPALPWSFQPVEREVKVKAGENRLVHFRAENRGSVPVVGRATFNVAPDIAGRYFSKIECFCFQEQVLDPGQTVEMPVSFFVDPAILTERSGKSFNEITLSYTFFRAPQQSAAAAGPSRLQR
jgi:cytochrome c oxidase assembly protein subunit 11